MKYKVIKEFPKSGNEAFNKTFTKDNIIEGQFNNSVTELGVKCPDTIKIVEPIKINEWGGRIPPQSIRLNLEDLRKKGYLEML